MIDLQKERLRCPPPVLDRLHASPSSRTGSGCGAHAEESML